MQKNKYAFILIIFGIFGYVYSFLEVKKILAEENYIQSLYIEEKQNLNSLYIKEKQIFYNIANTNETRQKGLSGIESLEENQGLLFIFEKEAVQSFWMKDMNFDIDIIWINKNKEIVGIEKNVSKETYNSKNPEASKFFISPENTLYVLEINAGFSDKNNFQIGDLVSF